MEMSNHMCYSQHISPGHQKRCATLVPEGLNMLMKSLAGGGWYLARSISPHGHGTDHLVNYLLVSQKKGDRG